jgi:L,D-transpeptidase YcbB
LLNTPNAIAGTDLIMRFAPMPRLFLAVQMAALLFLAAGILTKVHAQEIPIKEVLQVEIAEATSEARKLRLQEIEAHYAANDYTPVWLNGGIPNPKSEQMLDALALAYEDGLDPADYEAMELLEMSGMTDPEDMAHFEVQLSMAAVSFGQHLNAGRVNPRNISRELVIFPKAVAPDAILTNLRKTTQAKVYMRLLAPHTQRYERLRQALAAYRRIEENGGFSTVPDGPVLKPGALDERIPAIRQRMIEAGTLNPDLPVDADGRIYDQGLVEAVVRFQETMGLEALGTVGKQTLTAMNTPISRRIFEIELNLERNRWLQNEFAPYHVFANLADQVVKLVRDDKTIHAELIQVGQPYHRTPEFNDVMEYVEFNPYWGVPSSIAVNEYLPKLRKNPGVLAAQNISVFSGGKQVSAGSVNWSAYGKGNFPFTLRQEPGKGNALGRVKFMFPNDFNVYMHDTPAKAKFEESSRYFSHGCLRLNDPMKMAEMILGPEGWDRARIDSVVASGKNTIVRLKNPIPVYIVYLTAFVNKDGTINFREDVYGRDKALADALAKAMGRS